MLSDFRILDEALSKRQCLTCGTARRDRSRTFETLFASDYSLYAHAPGVSAEEDARQIRYADWLVRELQEPTALFEAGAGNGSLLRALRAYWNRTKFCGVEPSPAAALQARRAGYDVQTGALQQSDAFEGCELALAVNVIEHIADPLEFVRDLGSRAFGQVVIVAPDGGRPWLELLVADHLHSFTADGMRMLFARAGYTVTKQVQAPAELGSFLMTIGSRDRQAAIEPAPAPALESKSQYLSAWKHLDERLVERAGGSVVGCFGAGEAAALLRAYAPAAWSLVSCCYTDAPVEPAFGDIPVKAYGPETPSLVLLGVRPQSQKPIADRLSAGGRTCIRWDDLIPQ